jgi:toxin ParE1/3/4
MKLFWTETAKQDLLAIQRYIAVDNPTAAKKWVERLRERARNTVHEPLVGRKVPEFSRDDIRERIEGNYRIVYQVFEDRIVMLTVFESHALFPLENMDDSNG